MFAGVALLKHLNVSQKLISDQDSGVVAAAVTC